MYDRYSDKDLRGMVKSYREVMLLDEISEKTGRRTYSVLERDNNYLSRENMKLKEEICDLEYETSALRNENETLKNIILQKINIEIDKQIEQSQKEDKMNKELTNDMKKVLMYELINKNIKI